MPILLVAGLVAAAWLAVWKSSPRAATRSGAETIGKRLGSAVRAAARSWDENARRRLTEIEARALLGINETATRAEIEAVYRRLMLQAHPDHGGTAALAQRLTAARDELIKIC